MLYVDALVYDQKGRFRGHVILNDEANKLKSTNLWSDAELPKLQEQLDRLNVGNALMAHWPSLNDPEVKALLDSPTWEPLEMVPGQAVDEERSHFVYHTEYKVGMDGQPEIDPKTGQPIIINGELDRQASVVVFKNVMVPKEPIKVQMRTKKAQETIAKRRAGM